MSFGLSVPGAQGPLNIGELLGLLSPKNKLFKRKNTLGYFDTFSNTKKVVKVIKISSSFMKR
jgi:hypothetical protein